MTLVIFVLEMKLLVSFCCHFWHSVNKLGLPNALMWLHSGLLDFGNSFGSRFTDFYKQFFFMKSWVFHYISSYVWFNNVTASCNKITRLLYIRLWKWFTFSTRTSSTFPISAKEDLNVELLPLNTVKYPLAHYNLIILIVR